MIHTAIWGVLRKHLDCFLTCCSCPFPVATSKCPTNGKMSSNVSLSTLPNAICSRLLQLDWSSPFLAGRGVEAKIPRSHGLGVEPEPKFFTQCLLWAHVHRHCCLCVHSSCQLLPVLYSCIKPSLLNSSQNHRMVGIGKDLWRSPSPMFLLKQLTESRLSRIVSMWVLNVSREEESTTSLNSLLKHLKRPYDNTIFTEYFLCCSTYPKQIIPNIKFTFPAPLSFSVPR